MDPELRELERTLVDAIAARSPAAAARLYADDATFTPPGHAPIEGRVGIEAFLAGWIRRGLAGVALEPLRDDRSGDLAYTTARYTLTTEPAPGTMLRETGTSIAVYRRTAQGWRAAAHMFRPHPSDRALDEWKECRVSIDRFDRLIVTIRKYEFTLITGLLTAGAFLLFKADTNPSPEGQLGATIALLILTVALFSVDRAYEVFLRATVRRAMELELALGIRVTTEIGSVAEGAGASTWATWLYTFFVVSGLIPWLLMIRKVPWLLYWLGVLVCALSLVAIWVYHRRTSRALDQRR